MTGEPEAETAGASSLAYNGDRAQQPCQRKAGWFVFSLGTGAMFPARCDANFCADCAPVKAALIARAMARAAPQRMFRFSLVPSDFQETRAAVHSVKQWMRRNYGTIELAYHVEPNPRGTGNHLHGWQHGPNKIPQAALQEACQRTGLGLPDIRQWRQRRTGSGYGLKGIGYGMKADDLETFLDLNGGRLVHHSRGFFRDGVGGSALTLGQAKELARRDAEDPGPWVLRHESELSR